MDHLVTVMGMSKMPARVLPPQKSSSHSAPAATPPRPGYAPGRREERRLTSPVAGAPTTARVRRPKAFTIARRAAGSTARLKRRISSGIMALPVSRHGHARRTSQPAAPARAYRRPAAGWPVRSTPDG
jgi:hypothetical protein